MLNHNSLPQQLSYFNGLDYYKTHINHFDLFESQLDQISSSEGNKVGQLAQYWTLEFFNHFQQPHGELLPNENFIFKKAGLIMSANFNTTADRDSFYYYLLDNNILSNSTGERCIRFRPSLAITENEVNTFLKVVNDYVS